jgi:hypothetical protein
MVREDAGTGGRRGADAGPPCPKCHNARGIPVSVESAGLDRVVVGYRCESCRNEWQAPRALAR